MAGLFGRPKRNALLGSLSEDQVGQWATSPRAASKPKPRPQQQTQRATPGASISVPEKTLGEILAETLIAKPVAAVRRATGSDERTAQTYGSQVASNVETLTGLVGAQRSASRIMHGNGGVGDYVNMGAALLPGIGGRVAKRAVGAALAREAAPAVTNSLYREGLMGGNYSHTDPNLPQYAFRNVFNKSEVDDIARSGYMRPRKPEGQKYFTASNNPLGNPNNLTGAKPVLRVDTRYISPNAPVKAQHVQVWDDTLKRFVWLKK